MFKVDLDELSEQTAVRKADDTAKKALNQPFCQSVASHRASADASVSHSLISWT